MEPERWQDVERIYHSALQCDGSQRSLFLEKACGEDRSLRVEVESLLKYAQRSEELFEAPALEVVARSLAEDLRTQERQRADKMIGVRIAQYRILDKLGEGGMGDVYRAVRADDEYEKQVAIKLVRQGLDTDSGYERFRRERQILAGFEHENIARLLDGGTTDEGYPYFVMELVEGQPIDEYCDQGRLGVEARINLFQSVCSAVQYAHQRLVVHRDIKPGNILVTAEGVPKLLDFGIATILSAETYSPGAEPTVTVQRMLTPQFASPGAASRRSDYHGKRRLLPGNGSLQIADRLLALRAAYQFVVRSGACYLRSRAGEAKRGDRANGDRAIGPERKAPGQRREDRQA